MTRHEKLFNWLSTSFTSTFAYTQTGMAACGVKDDQLHDETCSFICSPAYVDDPDYGQIAQDMRHKAVEIEHGYADIRSLSLQGNSGLQSLDCGNGWVLVASAEQIAQIDHDAIKMLIEKNSRPSLGPIEPYTLSYLARPIVADTIIFGEGARRLDKQQERFRKRHQR